MAITKLSTFLGILVFQLFSCGVAWSTPALIHCTHFRLNDQKHIPSGKEVGFDVGLSPFGQDGVYECSVRLTEPSSVETPYLYLGEIGDASYVNVVSKDEGPLTIAPILHGLNPKVTENAKYVRFLP